ncbi:MAG: S8 family serine peptidase [Polyangiaceae bacterium]|nr:S8 family serine peptidase [Polyangiaceae bacterium]
MLGLGALLLAGCGGDPPPPQARHIDAVAQRIVTSEVELRLTLPVAVPFEGVAVGAGNSLALADRVTVVQPEGAFSSIVNSGTGFTNVGADAQTGSIWSAASLTLRNRAQVTGDARSARAITLQSGASVSGQVVANTPIPTVVHRFRVRRATTVPPSVSLEPDTRRTLAPGFYGPLNVKSRATLTLDSGHYFFQSVTIEPAASVRLSSSLAPTTIAVASAVIFRGTLETDDGLFPNLALEALGADPVTIEAPFRGTILALSGTLKLGGNDVAHEGSFFARSVQIEPGLRIVHRPFRWGLLQAPGPHGLKPLAGCVEPLGGGRYLALFGYSNFGAAPVTLPPGAENTFTGATESSGFATFLPGYRTGSHAAAFTGDSVSWTLDGVTATVSRRSNPCAPVELGAVRDTTASATSPDAVLGATATLEAGPDQVAFLAFDLRALRATLGAATYVDSATLELDLLGGSATGLELLEMEDPWTEHATYHCSDDANPANASSDCTGDARWTLGTPGFPPFNPWRNRDPGTAPTVTVVGDRILIDVTADVERAAYLEEERFGWALRSNGVGATIGSRESSRGPRLRVSTLHRDPALVATLPPLAVDVDPTLQPSLPTITGEDPAGTPLPVGVIADPDGLTTELVANEILLTTDDPQVLAAFVARWNAQIAFAEPDDEGPKTTCFAVIDTTRVHEEALPALLSELDNRSYGTHRASSPMVRELLAAAAESTLAGLDVDLEWLGKDDALTGPFVTRTLTEGGDLSRRGVGSNPFAWPQMQTGGVWNTGVAEAWRLLELAGMLEQSITVGVADRGFHEGADWPPDSTCRATRDRFDPFQESPEHEPWHGSRVVGSGFGLVNNAFGAAGPGGPVSRLITTYRGNATSGAVKAINDLRDETRIISMSFHFWAPKGVAFWARRMKRAVNRAHEDGVLLFASPGNDGEDVDARGCALGRCWEKRLFFPCELDHVTCVGGMQWGSTLGDLESNFGEESVDVWASYDHFSDPDPTDATSDFEIVSGTSYSTPFTAGIAALVWAANPDATAHEVMEALELGREPGLGRAAPGYYTALDPVRHALASRGPEHFTRDIEILAPADGDRIALAAEWMGFQSRVFYFYLDPNGVAQETECGPVRWVLEGPRDGSVIYSEVIADGPMLGTMAVPSPGRYGLTATLTTPDGLTATDSVFFRVENTLPRLELVTPDQSGTGINLWYPGPNLVAARAWDDEDGLLSCDVAWEVQGGSVVHDTSVCGRRVIQMSDPFGLLHLSVTDSQGDTATLDAVISPWGTTEGMPPQVQIAEPVSTTSYYQGNVLTLNGLVGAVGLGGDDSYTWAWYATSPYRTLVLQAATASPSAPLTLDLISTFGAEAPEFQNGTTSVTFAFRVWDDLGQMASDLVVVHFLDEDTYPSDCGALTCADDADCTAVCVFNGVCDKAQWAEFGCCRCAVP